MTSDLKKRFEQFVTTLDGFEDIDVLLKRCDPADKRRADYLFSNRSIIVEQKVLEVDPGDKAQKYLHRLMEEGRLVAWGTPAVDRDSFRDLPNGERLQKKSAAQDEFPSGGDCVRCRQADQGHPRYL